MRFLPGAKRSGGCQVLSSLAIRTLIRLDSQDMNWSERTAKCDFRYHDVSTVRDGRSLFVREPKAHRHPRSVIREANRKRDDRNVLRLVKRDHSLDCDFFFRPHWRYGIHNLKPHLRDGS